MTIANATYSPLTPSPQNLSAAQPARVATSLRQDQSRQLDRKPLLDAKVTDLPGNASTRDSTRPTKTLRDDQSRKVQPKTLRDALNQKGEDKPVDEVREAFTTFLGETFYTQLIKSMRSTVDKPAYMHGGRGEEVFQSQLDQMMAEEMTEASADQLAGPMFDLFQLNMRR